LETLENGPLAWDFLAWGLFSNSSAPANFPNKIAAKINSTVLVPFLISISKPSRAKGWRFGDQTRGRVLGETRPHARLEDRPRTRRCRGQGESKTELQSNVVLKAGEGGLTEESLALGEQFRSISTARFTKHLGHLAPHSVTAIGAALNIASTCSFRLLARLLRQRATAAITSSSPQL